MSKQGAILHSSLLECGWPRWCADVYAELFEVELRDLMQAMVDAQSRASHKRWLETP